MFALQDFHLVDLLLLGSLGTHSVSVELGHLLYFLHPLGLHLRLGLRFGLLLSLLLYTMCLALVDL